MFFEGFFSIFAEPNSLHILIMQSLRNQARIATLFWLAISLLATAAFGQEKPKELKGLSSQQNAAAAKPQRWTVNVDVGNNFFFGKVGTGINPAAGIGLTYYITPSFGVQGNGIFSQLKSNDANRPFQNNLFAYSLRGVIQLNSLLQMGRVTHKVIPYAFFGLGQFFSNVSGIPDALIVPGQVENNTSSGLHFNPGVGVKYNLSPRIDIRAQIDAYITNSRWLSGWNQQLFANQGNEHFGILSIGVNIRLGKKSAQNLEWEQTINNLNDLFKTNEFKDMASRKADPIINDKDNDGVMDQLDQDPNTPAGVRVDTRGVPIDTDYDGIPDYKDPCPLAAGPKGGNGCPMEQRSGGNDTPREPIVKNTEPVAPTFHYHIVSGSYLNVQQAQQEVLRLKTNGYPQAQIVKHGAPLPTYRVSVRQYADVDLAIADLDKLKAAMRNDKLWIFNEDIR